MTTVVGYSEISILNPQTRYFQKKVKCRFFKKRVFWGYDLENWVWAKLMLWICPILWIRVKMGYTQLSLTFFHYYRPIRPIYQKIKKIIFSKNHDFWIKNVLQRGEIWFNRDSTLVPSPHKHSLQTHKFNFSI